MTLERIPPPVAAPGREMLVAWLEFHRATLQKKCAGLGPAELSEASVPPSPLSLIGLVRHLTDVERRWMRERFLGETVEYAYRREDGTDVAFTEATSGDASEAMAAWETECENSRRIVASTPSLETLSKVGRRGGDLVSLRWLLVHLLEEYARHNGHADFLRERIDGVVGS